MNFDSAERSRDAATPIGSTELAEGLLLVRASTLKMIRLQLAMERRDRHVALEAVDDLVALDCQLRDYLEGIPATGDQLMFRRELEGERAALNQEKLTLAAEVLLRPAEPPEQADPVQGGDDWLGPREFKFEPQDPRRNRWWLAAFPIIAAGAAAAAYFVSGPEIAAWITAAAGAIR
jgi:hypothetical protein